MKISENLSELFGPLSLCLLPLFLFTTQTQPEVCQTAVLSWTSTRDARATLPFSRIWSGWPILLDRMSSGISGPKLPCWADFRSWKERLHAPPHPLLGKTGGTYSHPLRIKRGNSIHCPHLVGAHPLPRESSKVILWPCGLLELCKVIFRDPLKIPFKQA